MLFLCLYGKLIYPAKINLAWSITLRYTASISRYFFFLIFFCRRSPAEPGLTNAVRKENGRRETGFNTGNQEIHILGAVFSQKLAVEEKLHIMQTEYDIPEEDDFRKDVNEMCNLGEGIMEEGIAIGMEKGREEGIAIGETRGREEGITFGENKGRAEAQAELIRNMHKNGLTAEQIAAATDKNIEEVKVILESKE